MNIRHSTLSRLALAACVVAALSTPGQAQSSAVRLKVVNVPVDSGLLAEVLPEFERSTGYRVEVDKRGDQVFDLARQGQTDLVISHYGHHGLESFMADGLGLWPKAVFANQAALIGPSTDPAGIRGITDAVEAFRRIAQTNSRFLVNNAPTEKYLGRLLWESSGRPAAGELIVDSGIRDQQAIQAAERMGAYVLWGIIPFLKFKETTPSGLEALVLDDPIFQRVMMAVVVNPERVPGVNVPGALALQKYLSLPGTQAKIRAFRYPGVNHQLFWPAARDNSGSFLEDVESPLGTPADPAATGISFEPSTVRLGGSVTSTVTGSNLSARTYFDVRFRIPGSTTEQVALNWQEGTAGSHLISPGTATGTWTITGLRAHRELNDHGNSFITVNVRLSVAP